MRTRWMLLTAMVIAMPTAALSVTYTDNFDDGATSPMWVPYSVDLPLPLTKDGSLQFFIPGLSTGPAFRAAVHSNFRLCGDFDVKVDFEHPLWPWNNGVRTAITVGNKRGGYALERTSMGHGVGEYVLSDTGGYLETIPYSMTQGTLRIRRVGMEVTGYVWTGNWQPLATWYGAIGPMDVELAAWSHDGYFGGMDVQATFDNFAAVDSASILNGSISLGDYVGNLAGQPLEVLLVQNGTIVDSQVVVLDDMGRFQLMTEAAGEVVVMAKGSHWLRRASPPINLAPNGLQLVDLALTNGDVDGNNMIDSDDFDLFVVNFGGQNVVGDLDGNTMVDSDDFDILVAHFGEQGD